MDVPFILMYSFFALLNVKIFLSVGVICYFRKVYSQKSLKNLSELIVNAFLPIFGIIEVARMANPANMQVFWIMILSVIFSMLVGFYSAKIIQYFFKLDIRISSSYNLLCCVPSIGTLPLVLGRAFCFPGGPLEGDEQCSNILGYMMINYLVFQVGLFLIGFFLIARDANYGYILDDKMGLTWHIVCEKVFKKNYFILHLFRKYFKDKKLADKLFEEFENNNKLIRNEGEITYRFVCLDNDQAVDDIKNYYNELRKSQQIMKPIISNEQREEPIEDLKIKEQEEDEASDYLQQFVEPRRAEKDDDYDFTEIKRDSSIKMKPNIEKFSDQKNNTRIKTQFNLNDEEKRDFEDYRKSSVNSIQFKNNYDNDDNDKSGLYFDSRENSIKEKESISPDVDNEENEIDNNRDKEIKLENIIIKRDINDSNTESEELDNPTIKKIPPLVIDEKTNIKKKKLNEQALIVPSFNVRNFQSEYFRPKQEKIERDHSIHFQISKRDKFAKSLALTSEQQKKIHLNLENFLLERKENIILKPDINYKYDYFISRESLNKFQESKEDKIKKMKEINSQIFNNQRITFSRMVKHKSIFDTGISRYYQKMFRVIEQNLNKDCAVEYELEKSEIIKNLHDIPPKFPIARGIEVNRINIREIDAIWDDYLIAIKKLNNEFELHSCLMRSDFELVINAIHSPAVVGTILGLIIGVSGMRDVLFSLNHYITNLVDGILVLTRATVPFLYVSVGVSFVTIRGFSLNLPVSKKHMILSMIIRFIILPGFGLLWTYIWTEYYGGIIQQSRVFRISLFIPFCVPSSANLVLLTNILKYFIAESNLLLVSQNLSLLITLTVLYMIYFVTIGV